MGGAYYCKLIYILVTPKCLLLQKVKVSKGVKISNRYNQVPHLTEDTNAIYLSFTSHINCIAARGRLPWSISQHMPLSGHDDVGLFE